MTVGTVVIESGAAISDFTVVGLSVTMKFGKTGKRGTSLLP